MDQFLLYGKVKGDKRMRPIDIQSGNFVNRLGDASLIRTREEAEEIVEELKADNPGMTFEVRELK